MGRMNVFVEELDLCRHCGTRRLDCASHNDGDLFDEPCCSLCQHFWYKPVEFMREIVGSDGSVLAAVVFRDAEAFEAFGEEWDDDSFEDTSNFDGTFDGNVDYEAALRELMEWSREPEGMTTPTQAVFKIVDAARGASEPSS